MSDRIGAEIWVDIPNIMNRHRFIVSFRKAKAGLREPMRSNRFEVLLAADAFHIWLRRKRRMPGQNFEAIEPAVLVNQKPSFMAEGLKTANSANWTFWSGVIHRAPWK
jgi:hypothetical protein